RRFGYELSACQVESKTPPAQIGDVLGHLEMLDGHLDKAASALGLHLIHDEVGPDDMPLDVYDDPTGRYQMITSDMPRDRLLAACRIIGTHIHIGMPDHRSALHVYNTVISDTNRLCKLGDNSGGRRLSIYRDVNPYCHPRSFAGWDEFYVYASRNGCVDDPRRCWTLIRISIHGTIEFRMFGTTACRPKVAMWAQTCYQLCADAMA